MLGEPPRTEHVNVFAIARRPVSRVDYAEFARETGRPAGAGDPIEDVSWADAVSYCRWLQAATGRVYRLPDEREWEKAARAGVLDGLGERLEWTNTWGPGGRVLRGRGALGHRHYPRADLRGVGFRVVRSMTGR